MAIFPFPGFAPSGITEPWWFAFHQTRDIPEALVQGKELMYLSYFYHNAGGSDPAAITQEDINEYVSHYSAPGGMRAGFEHYRAFPQDAIQNQNYSKTKLTMPVLAIGGANSPVGGTINTSGVVYGMKMLAQNVQGIIVPNSGHWIPEEQPDFVIKVLDNFFGGNTTKTK